MAAPQEIGKHVIDGAAVAVPIATYVNWLPDIAAGVSIIWLLFRIYETQTVQGWVNRRRK